MKKIMVCMLFLCATCAYGGDEQLAKQYIDKSGFREGVLKLVRTKVGNSADGVISSMEMSALEANYAQILGKHLSNEELRALLKAYDVPGFRSAMQKLPLVSSEMMAIAFKKGQAIMDKASSSGAGRNRH